VIASVVVPARDAAETLPALLRSLAGQTLERSSFEVIVVDNASADATAWAAREGGADRVVMERTPGRARARNTGAAAAGAPRIAFTDADCTVDPGWLEALCGCLERVPLAAGPVRLLTGTPPNAVERLESLWRFQQEDHVRDDGWAASANLGITRAAWDALGGFDAGFERIGEDVDLCLRARAAGLQLGFCPGAGAAHPVEHSLPSIVRRGVAHGWSNRQLAARHPALGATVYWRHPGPLVRGTWALERFGARPGALAPRERRRLDALARVEYAARMAGSATAALRRIR
jgi:glycosyltransferase involved in cell wall biosynthesis